MHYSGREKTKRFPLLGLLLAGLLLSGCDNWGPPNKPEKIPDAELREKWRGCQNLKEATPLTALSCDNYIRECKRRKKKEVVCY